LAVYILRVLVHGDIRTLNIKDRTGTFLEEEYQTGILTIVLNWSNYGSPIFCLSLEWVLTEEPN